MPVRLAAAVVCCCGKEGGRGITGIAVTTDACESSCSLAVVRRGL